MLVHVCCSVDSHYFIEELQKLYPEEKLSAFFYDPNIHPYSEYYLRLLEVKRSCEKLGVDLIEGEYDYERWFDAVKGNEHDSEKGKRCSICFDDRFEVTAQKAQELGHDSYTTTLLMSPKKSIPQLVYSGKALEKKYSTKFVGLDLKVDGGNTAQYKVARDEEMYHQDYCGCFYALEDQREEQGNKFVYETMRSIGANIQRGSIEERVEIYEKRYELEKQNKSYKIIRQKILNYRLLTANVKVSGEVIPSYIFSYSMPQRKFSQTRMEFSMNNIHYSKHANMIFLDIEKFNSLANTEYQNVLELMYNPISTNKENQIRMQIFGEYSLSAIVVVDKVEDKKYKIFIDAVTYDDNVYKLLNID
ncbi:MAG: FIG053235: Diacylglucosamine hydrolase like [uncultured Campylobacterales bacterium]|uniref:Epoxyqueuosine reductase QueH n=1 Tax=uncultured Campylobacterales bacterium TaxID=352960 RepID=A0A6S6T3B0_9BACT|nr:MAG: FIG053235: Diacylglucosamine hydrolase like [uncultured Campylobacterales bacterium]